MKTFLIYCCRTALTLTLIFALNTPNLHAQTMTYSSCACEPGFSFSGWGYDGGADVIYVSMPNVNHTATITRNVLCWNAISFETRPFVNNNPPGGGTWRV